MGGVLDRADCCGVSKLIRHMEVQGMKAIVLENEHLQLVFIPQLGSKMISMTNKHTGREWLDRPEGRAFQTPDYGSLWGDWDRCGWDELFPSISPCVYPEAPWSGIQVPDHGELWPLPWQVEHVDDCTLLFTVHGVRWPYQLQKQVCLQGNQIHLAYKLSNLCPYPLQYLWAPHPLVAASSTMKVKFPASVQKVIISGASEGWLGQRGGELDWPSAYSSERVNQLDQMPPPEAGLYYKLYATEAVPEGWCAIEDLETGESFTFTYDADRLPYLGLWVNAKGWGGEYHLALEPSSGHLDDLAEARQRGASATIAPFSEQQWTLCCTVR